MSDAKTVLIADDETNLRRVLAAQLESDGFEVREAENGQAALQRVREGGIDVLITDLRMPELDGMALLELVVAEQPTLPVVMITAHGTIHTAVEALKLGAFDYITKPFDRDEFRSVLGKAIRSHDLSQDLFLGQPQDHSEGRYRLIGKSPPMEDIYSLIEKAADSPSTVLITGESGTGKELIARALHEHSGRKERAFIRVNCAALPPELVESELFGYQKGAFTGAVSNKPGRFELADGGTLFLDEIGEIPTNMQVKLLRAIQESEFERVGGIKTIKVDVRLVAATNRELTSEIEAGRFREDLYYRLNVVQIRLPPLRERHADIPLLVQHFRRHYNDKLSKNVESVSEEAMALLVSQAWRGNIRELENVMERCVLFCEGTEIGREHLPPEFQSGTEASTPLRSADAQDSTSTPAISTVPLDQGSRSEGKIGELQDAIEEARRGGLKQAVRTATARLERELIVKALEETGQNVTHAARKLRISRKSLQMKMKELGLREED